MPSDQRAVLADRAANHLLVGYARVSTEPQDLTAQRNSLAALGVGDDRIYVDHGLTGTNRDRPGLRLALAACHSGDTLVGDQARPMIMGEQDESTRTIGEPGAARYGSSIHQCPRPENFGDLCQSWSAVGSVQLPSQVDHSLPAAPPTTPWRLRCTLPMRRPGQVRQRPSSSSPEGCRRAGRRSGSWWNSAAAGADLQRLWFARGGRRRRRGEPANRPTVSQHQVASRSGRVVATLTTWAPPRNHGPPPGRLGVGGLELGDEPVAVCSWRGVPSLGRGNSEAGGAAAGCRAGRGHRRAGPDGWRLGISVHQDDCHHINRTVGAVVTIAAGSAADQMTRPRPSRCLSMTVAATRGVSGSRPRGASVKDG